MPRIDPADALSRTMRIDIAPATVARAGRGRRAAAASGTFVARRRERKERDTPFDKLLASVYDAVLITDPAGHVLDCNQRAEEFFLIAEERLLGMSVLDLISGASETLLDAIRQNLHDHKYTVVEARCSRADGSFFPAEIAVNRVDLDATGQLGFFVRDTTVRTKAQQELQNAVERLEALDRARLEFVSNVSHELRTPLTSMIYAVKNMLRGVAGPLPAKAMQYLERLDADCRRLLGTVSDILDLRQIENRTLTLTQSRVPWPRLVENAVDALRVQADEKRIQLRVAPPSRPCFVTCDPHKMERVFLNIIGNAIKFTPSGGTIRVLAEPDDAHPGLALARVSDDGIGIPREALERVTLRYFKVGDQPTGSGLGLAISRELVELHGGQLAIESPVPGTTCGTQVSVRLRLVDPPTVLAVAADEGLRAQLQSLCAAQGYIATTAATGQEALAVCRKAPPDVLLLDLALPDLPGVELVLQVKRDRKTARLPLLALTDDTLPRAQMDVLQGFGIPLVPKQPREADLATRLNGIFLVSRAVPQTLTAAPDTRATATAPSP